MKELTSFRFKNFTSLLLLVLLHFTLIAQVGIGTTSPNSNALLDVDATASNGGILLPRLALTSTASFAPLSAHVAGMMVYNTAPKSDVTPGFYYNDGMKWNRLGAIEPPIDMVTLAADYSLAPALTFTDVPAMSVTFVARKTSVLVTLSGSGDSTRIGAGIGDFQVVHDPSGTIFGGTHEKLVQWDDAAGLVGAAWSISFTKPFTGLTIGNTYILKVQALLDPTLVFLGAPPTLNISPVTLIGDHHLTLSVIQ